MEESRTEEEQNQREGKGLSTREWAEKIEYDPHKLFEKVQFLMCYDTMIIYYDTVINTVLQLFCSDINYLLTMDKLWQTRQAPSPLQLDQLSKDSK